MSASGPERTSQFDWSTAAFGRRAEMNTQRVASVKTLDEKVARLHLAKVGVKLTELRKYQADYIGVKVEGPFKAEHYRS